MQVAQGRRCTIDFRLRLLRECERAGVPEVMLRSRLFSLLYGKVTSEPICNAPQTYPALPQALLRGLSASSASGLGAAVRGLHTSSIQQDFVTLNNISDNPGATKTGKRLGRGIGSGKGKTSGRGHKGQKARTGRKVKIGFEGGQTPIKQYTPKRGFHNPFSNEYVPLNLFKLKEAIDMGRLTERQLITMRDLREAGVIHRKIKDGVKLLGRGAAEFDKSVNLQVSQVSDSAKQAVERQGGSVTTVYYNKLGLRALTMPEWFEKKGRSIPKAARPHPKKRDVWDAIGSLPPSPMPAPSASSAQAQVRSPE